MSPAMVAELSVYLKSRRFDILFQTKMLAWCFDILKCVW